MLCIAFAAASAACSGCGNQRDFSVDDHESFKCADDARDHECGVENELVVLNRVRDEYLFVWQARYGDAPTRLYARRIDARTGHPKTGPIRLYDTPGTYVTFVVAFDPASREY